MQGILSFFQNSFTIIIPLLFAATAGLFPVLAGSLNISLEGLLLIGAFSSFAVFHYTGSITAALLAAGFSAMVLSALHAFTAFKLKANLFITGLAVNILSAGLCVVLSERIFNTRGVVVSQRADGLLMPFLAAAFVLVIFSIVFIYKTPFGFRLRACDKNAESLASLGYNVTFYKTTALLICAFFCGIGGAFLSLNLGAFVQGMSAGKGWIALVIIFLGGRKPHGLLAAAFVFSLVQTFSAYAQGFLALPADFILAFPYIFTLIVMIFVSINIKTK